MRPTVRYGFCLLALLLFSSDALAQSNKKNPLAGAPAVRHRYELRENRFEIGPSFNFSLNRSLRHAILIGARMHYHINDYLSVGADVGYGIGLDTGLTGELEDNYNKRNLGGEWQALSDRFADIQLAGDVRLVFTPFAGKMAVFGKLFFAYDLFFFTGFGFAMTKNNTDSGGNCPAGIADCDYDEANEGFRPGFAWGFGIRMFFAKWMAMGVEVKDLLFADNEPGGDITRGLASSEVSNDNIVIDGDDKTFGNHFFVGVNFTFFFPTMPAISD